MSASEARSRITYSRLDSSKTLGAPIEQEAVELTHISGSKTALLHNGEQSTNNTGIEASVRRKKWHSLSGWRTGSAFAATGALLTFAINVGVSAWASRSNDQFRQSGILVELFHGDCKKAANLNTYTHLLINIVSTLLLSGSNYCMQCLASPTRKDVDAAHAQMKWLDIGVPSVRNLRHISTTRKVLWVLLVASSLPLHLMFNSAFFTSLTTNDYNVVFATDNFTIGASYSTQNGFNTAAFQPPIWKENLTEIQRLVQEGRFERLENADCIRAYAVDLNTDRRTVVVISSNESLHDNGAVLGSGNEEFVKPQRWYELQVGYDPFSWLCSDRDAAYLGLEPSPNNGLGPKCFQYADKLLERPDAWSPSDWAAEYCLSEQVSGPCSFYINLAIAWIVVCCNLVKVITMGYLVFSGVLDKPFCTIGDAIVSFVTEPDLTTKDMCLTSRQYMIKHAGTLASLRRNPQTPPSLHEIHQRYGPLFSHLTLENTSWRPQKPQVWQVHKQRRWYNAPSSARWTWAALFYAACIGTVIGLLGRAMYFYTGDKSFATIRSLGLGHPNSQTVITGWEISSMNNKAAAIVLSVLIANTPQLVLSMLYFSINGLATCMSLASEWSRYSYSVTLKDNAKTLRTSDPCGQQRSTYFLQLPFRFAIPLISMSALLHWLISQSIFLAVVSVYDELGILREEFAVISCGFSFLAMILLILVGAVMAICVIGVSFLRLHSGMTLVGSCSAAISAACHVQSSMSMEDRWDIVKGPVVWGDVGRWGNGIDHSFAHDIDDEVRHCTFVSAFGSSWSQQVGPPLAGKQYA